MPSDTSKFCIFCSKECKSNDSRPFPNSKSKDRIHNKCQIKKSLSDKRQPNPVQPVETSSISPGIIDRVSILDRLAKDEDESKLAASRRLLDKLAGSNLIEDDKAGQYFFDLKAGIAKPHEKKRFLHHRNLSEIATRYDDNGFHQEAAGRAYDHNGKDLNTLGDSDHDDDSEDNEHHEQLTGFREEVRKRKLKTDRNEDRPERRQKIKLDDQNPCWFCLSSPKVEKHLIVAIGDHCYLALAKGGLVDEHFLLIPIEHVQSLNDGSSEELMEELELFKKSLVSYFGSRGQGVVFFERNFRSVHWQIQVVPVPQDRMSELEKNIKSVSRDHFSNADFIDIPSNCSLSDIIPQNTPYFFWQIEPVGKKFVTQIRVKGSFFPIQLGRLVLSDSSILNCPEKVDWKLGTKTKEEYENLVTEVKRRYKDFHFD